MNTTSQRSITKRAGLILAGLTILSPLAIVSVGPIGSSSAEAQIRNRSRDYRDDELSRLQLITRQGRVTSNVQNDYFEMRGDDNTNYRILARENVSLRGINRDDRVEVYGRRDGNIIIAQSVRRIGSGGSTGNLQTLRAVVQENLPGNRFTVRHLNRNVTVVARNGEPTGLRAGRQVEMSGYFANNSNIFQADRVILIDDDGGNWQDGRDTTLRGVVVSDQGNRRFTLRINNNQTINVTTRDEVGTRVRNGDSVEVRGRWNRNERQFRADSVRLLNSNNNNPVVGSRIEFRGVIVNVQRVLNTYVYRVEAEDRRIYTVRFSERFNQYDRVRVRGTLEQGNVVVARDIDRA